MNNNERIFIKGKEVASKQYADEIKTEASKSVSTFQDRFMPAPADKVINLDEFEPSWLTDGKTLSIVTSQYSGSETNALARVVTEMNKTHGRHWKCVVYTNNTKNRSVYVSDTGSGGTTVIFKRGTFLIITRQSEYEYSQYVSTVEGPSILNPEAYASTGRSTNNATADSPLARITSISYQLVPDIFSGSGVREIAMKSFVTNSIASAIGNISSFSLLPVETLPTENIQTNIIYAVPSENPEENDERVEWVYVNEKWECLGTRKIDLSNYYNKTEVDALLLTSGGLQVLDATDANNPIDFNDYVEPGTMYLVKGGNFVNGPSTTRSEWGDWGYLINNNKPEIQKKVYQTYVTVPYCFTNGGITINHNIYYRSKSTSTTTSTWSSWSERDPLTSEYSRDWMNELRDVIGLSQRGAYNMYKELTTITGALQSLGTTDKTSLVNAINELNSKIGDINSILETMTDVEEASE